MKPDIHGEGNRNLSAATGGSSKGHPPSSGRILPGATIGVLGGGQLGRMMALAGRAMGYRFVTLDPTPDAPCGQVADLQIVASYDDQEAARQLAERSDVITYEFENVDADVAAMLMEDSYVPQGSQLLFTTQHRLREKQAIESAGVSVAPYVPVRSLEDLQEGVRRLGLPCVLKTVTGGYDGKGQRIIDEDVELASAYQALSSFGTDLVLEKFVHYTKEISVIVARSSHGEIATFMPAENIHVNNILHVSMAPARISREIVEEAQRIAVSIAKELEVVGLLAVEMFVTAQGELFVNELAPRPHNSGHYTMDACRTSQFEQHIRAICGLPLASTELLTPVVMVNVLGEHVAPLLEWMASGGEERLEQKYGITAKIHLYGKSEVKPGRKMGHLNLLTDDVTKALNWIRESPIWA